MSGVFFNCFQLKHRDLTQKRKEEDDEKYGKKKWMWNWIIIISFSFREVQSLRESCLMGCVETFDLPLPFSFHIRMGGDGNEFLTSVRERMGPFFFLLCFWFILDLFPHPRWVSMSLFPSTWNSGRDGGMSFLFLWLLKRRKLLSSFYTFRGGAHLLFSHVGECWLFVSLSFLLFRFVLSFRGLRNVFDGNANSRTWRTSGYNDDESSDSTTSNNSTALR